MHGFAVVLNVRYSDNGYICTDNAGTWIQILEVHRMGFVGWGFVVRYSIYSRMGCDLVEEPGYTPTLCILSCNRSQVHYLWACLDNPTFKMVEPLFFCGTLKHWHYSRPLPEIDIAPKNGGSETILFLFGATPLSFSLSVGPQKENTTTCKVGPY